MLVGADLDNAVHEFYQHFKPLIEKQVDEYLREVREENMQRGPGQSGVEPDRVRMQELYDAGLKYWIHGDVVFYYSGAMPSESGKGVVASGRYALAKRAKYDVTDRSNRGTSYYQLADAEDLTW